MTKSNFKSALQTIYTRLSALGDSGPEGFEGLLRDVLGDLTKTPFHVAKSGPQAGSDVRNDPSNAFRVGLEAKKYATNTPLPLDALKAKIVDASLQPNMVDLWILAASREITITNREALHQAGEAVGIKVIVLDWPKKANKLPDLAVILAASRAMALSHMPGADVEQALDIVSADPRFCDRREGLVEEFTTADVGFAAASVATASWMDAAQSTKANAQSRLRGHNDLKCGDSLVVGRTEISARLDDWWEDRAGTAALLGDEGVGKTWSALSWWNSKDWGGKRPLTIYVSSRDVNENNFEPLVCQAIATQTGVKDTAFWEKRLKLWKSEGAKERRILIILDGLNENFFKSNWRDTIQPLFETSLGAFFSVVLTCWPSRWAELNQLKPLEPAPREIVVQGFSDKELDSFLAGATPARKRDEFSSDVLKLMRIPRLSQLALRCSKEMKDIGDVTAERIAYEDWKHRVDRGTLTSPWSDLEFQNFIAEIGSELKEQLDTLSISQKELMERLGRDSGAAAESLRDTVAALVAGRWFENTDKPNRFRVNKSLAPFMLGLALSSQLRALETKEAAELKIADFMDPFKGQSLAAAILRSATTVALVSPTVSRSSRRALAERWLQEQNFGRADFDAWWKILGNDPELFCDLAEAWWLKPGSGGLISDEVLIKGFANASAFDHVRKSLQKRLETWLGWVWRDPEEGAFLGRVDHNSERSRANQERVQSNLTGWLHRGDRGQWPEIVMKDEGHVSWLSHRAVGVLSYLPLDTSINAIVAWAISRAVMGRDRHFDEIAWVLRLNSRSYPEGRKAIWSQMTRLLETGSPLARQAAVWLLDAIGDIEAARRAGEIRAADNTLAHANEMIFEPPHLFASPLDAPQLQAKQMLESAIDKGIAFHSLPQTQALFGQGRSVEIKPMLHEIFNLAASGSKQEANFAVERVQEIALLLTPQECEELANRFASGAADPRDSTFEIAMAILKVAGRSALEQYSYIAALKFPFSHLNALKPFLVEATEDESELIGRALPAEATPEELSAILSWIEAGDWYQTVRNWSFLARSLHHPNDEYGQKVFTAVLYSENEEATLALALSDWSATTTHHRVVRAIGSAILLRAYRLNGDSSILSRVDPEAWGYLLGNGDTSDETLDRFLDFTKDQLAKVLATGPKSYPQRTFQLDRASHLLVQHRKAEVTVLVSDWLNAHQRVIGTELHEEFPLYTLCKAMLTIGLPEGLDLWARVSEIQDNGIAKITDVPFLPLWLPVGQLSKTMIDDFTSKLVNDYDLRIFMKNGIKRGHNGILAQTIRDDLASPNASSNARGWRLLGYSHPDPVFDSIWNDYASPEVGWLKEVARISRREYDLAAYSFSRFREAQTLSSPSEIDGAFHAMMDYFDYRHSVWFERISATTEPRNTKFDGFMSVYHDALDTKLKKQKTDSSDKLFGQRIMKNTLWPWA